MMSNAMKRPRTSHLHVMVDETEDRMVDELSASTGQDRSNFVRSLIRREHETRFGRPAVSTTPGRATA